MAGLGNDPFSRTVYGQGSGADCRRHVQKLNALRGEVLQAEDMRASLPRKQEASETRKSADEPTNGGDQLVEGVKTSCWSKYLESKVDRVLQEEPEEEENVYTDREDFAIFRNAYKTNSRKHQRGWSSSFGQSPHLDPREVHHPRKRAKKQKRELDQDLQSNRRVSGKVSPRDSTTNTTLPAAEASAFSRQSFVAEPPPQLVASERAVQKMTSNWARFLAQSCDGEEAKESSDVQEDSCSDKAGAIVIEGSSRVVSAQAAVGHDLSRALGSDGGSFATRGLADISAPRTGSSWAGVLHSLFQTEDDFDDTF
ncbi:MRN complex-interacting protein isoform X2 [Paramormyrops kingsleyae]|uniref:MRN complex-interacting protein isoform X2 n=1 Tax=Paramormyrops kingsleyae TaxID=1676925 RepID=UPI000CD60CB8|nr:MRN complex-interacting protein isoform X2 [Paramormyrops kingsleyae]